MDVQDDFTNWIQSSPMKNDRHIGDNVVFTKSSSSATETEKNSHRQFQRICLIELVKIYNGVTIQAHLIAQKRTEWQKDNQKKYYLRNVHDKMAIGKAAFEKTYGQNFDGPSILFGTLVEYIPITTNLTSTEYISLEIEEYSWVVFYVREEVGQEIS